jgi:hypothetical protein
LGHKSYTCVRTMGSERSKGSVEEAVMGCW